MTLVLRRLALLLGCFAILGPARLWPQEDAPQIDGADDSGHGEKHELEERIRDLEERLEGGGVDDKELKRKIRAEVEKRHSRGVITIGGAELRFGGKIELNFIDTESFTDPVIGTTANPDPHLVLDRLRLEPTLDIGRRMEAFAQVDFLPDSGDSFLKEAGLMWEFRAEDYWDDIWWLRSTFQLGLDDRFIHRGPAARVTESYPLIGTAFWRDEEIAFMWEGRLGNRRGEPIKKKRKRGAELDFVPRSDKTKSTAHGPLDFEKNPGALKLNFSIGDGYTLSGKETFKDEAVFQELLHDNRETKDGLSLRSLGFGVGYERDFNWLGELEGTFFYYDDQLSEQSIAFLQSDLTVRDGMGNTVAGYGDSDDDDAHRIGFRVNYHLEGYHVLDRWMDTYPGDGLYAVFEWIEASDGQLDRDGYYVQASYRFSFVRPLIADRYFKYIEPVVRYGELNVGGESFAELPLTWDRRQFVFGSVVGVTKHVFLKLEYVMSDESFNDGPSEVDHDVSNDAFLVQLLLEF